MALRTRVWGVGRMLVVAGALVVTFFVFFAAAARIAIRRATSSSRNSPDSRSPRRRRPWCRWPDPAGRRGSPNRSQSAGRAIVGQEPRPGSITRRPRAIRVWLSAGARAPVVPDLVGSTERAADSGSQGDGLNLLGRGDPVGRLPRRHRHRPMAAGQGEGRRRRAAGQSQRARRHLRDARRDRARRSKAADLLRGWGFRASVVGILSLSRHRPDIVLRQSPRAGFQVAPGDAISLEVSR